MSVLILHNRYRTQGGEERAVTDQAWLFREQMGLEVKLLERDSVGLSAPWAGFGLLSGGLNPGEVTRAVRANEVQVVHAHNMHPTFGWRALAAARAAGAAVVMHLHNYRLVCAVGTCLHAGIDCTSCHGRNTVPGVWRRCRGQRVEAVVYGTALAGWQRRLVAQVDAFVVPSEFARTKLRALGAPLPWERVHVLPHFVRRFAEDSAAAQGKYALVVARLSPEKGLDVAVRACARAQRPLVVAGDGPERGALEKLAQREMGDSLKQPNLLKETALQWPTAKVSGNVCFVGRIDDSHLWELRRGAAVELVPSRAPETFGLAALEAQAAGVPVVASRSGALPELVAAEQLFPSGSDMALATVLQRFWGDATTGLAGLKSVHLHNAQTAAVTFYRELHAYCGL